VSEYVTSQDLQEAQDAVLRAEAVLAHHQAVLADLQALRAAQDLDWSIK
jgi:hypothetical protein